LLFFNPFQKKMIAASALLQWYKQFQRPLPWRQTTDPYAVWLSEIILQQTRVDQGTAYWYRFLQTFPTVHHLAQATEEEVLKTWQGLGYYARARNLHRAAQIISAQNHFPTDYDSWKALPGIGPYTAAALASILHHQPTPVVDGNVIRVTGRYFGLNDPPAPPYPAYLAAAQQLLDSNHPGNSNQALMELGATVCTPQQPRCTDCPLSTSCFAFRNGVVDQFPKPKKPIAVQKLTLPMTLVLHNGRVAVQQRTAGFWRGLYQFPEPANLPASPPALELPHVLTHRKLTLAFYPGLEPAGTVAWQPLGLVEGLPWPQPLAHHMHRLLSLATERNP
jgi:A/G-specific adenine glycosylase